MKSRSPSHSDDGPDLDALRQDYAALTKESLPSTHPDEETWVLLASGELAGDERERLAAHVFDCADCAQVYRAVALVRESAADFDKGAPAPQRTHTSRVWTYAGLALAAGIVLAVGAVLALRWGNQNDQGQTAQAIAPAATVSPRIAPPEPREWARGGEVPDVRLPASLALAIRGENADRDALLREFGEAIAPYREGHFKEAAQALTPLAQRWPAVPEVAFYLGVSHLFAGDPSSAIAPLRQARTSEVVGQDARWYEAIALERSGKRDDADAALRGLCESPGPYRAGACAVVR
jgi:hypothetical protein